MLMVFLNVFLYVKHWPCMKGYKRKIWNPYVMDVQGESNVPLHLEKNDMMKVLHL
jgi:hypothetical protein